MDIIEYLKQIDMPTVANAIEKSAVRNRISGFCSSDIRQMMPELGVMCGYAVTADVMTTTPDNIGGLDKEFINLCRLIETLPKPTIIVFRETGPHRDMAAHCGEIMSTVFKKLGACGLLTDSCVRDLIEVKAIGFQYFATGLVASHGTFRITGTGMPVSVGGLVIKTGDILHGDVNGIISVPNEVLLDLKRYITMVREAEGKLLEYIKSNEFSIEGLKEILTH